MTNRDLGRSVWRKSARSGGATNCVEVTDTMPGTIAVRDSKNPGGPPLRFAHAAWGTFTRKVKMGEYDQQ